MSNVCTYWKAFLCIEHESESDAIRQSYHYKSTFHSGGYFLSHLYFPLSYHSHPIVPLPSCRVSLATIKIWGRWRQRYFVKCRRTLLELHSWEPYLSSEGKRKFRRGLFTSSMKRGKKTYTKAWRTCEVVVLLVNCFFSFLLPSPPLDRRQVQRIRLLENWFLAVESIWIISFRTRFIEGGKAGCVLSNCSSNRFF